MGIAIVVPTYNEADNIGVLMRRVLGHVADVHLIVVDDDSPDGTARLVTEFANDSSLSPMTRIEVVSGSTASEPTTDPNRSNLTDTDSDDPAGLDGTAGGKCGPSGPGGLGNAYRLGIAYALEQGAEVVVQLDADLSHDPHMIPALVANVELGADLAIGSRYVPGGRTIDWPWQRRVLSRWGNRYAAGVLGLAVNDVTSGFRAYSASILREIDVATVAADGYGFQVEMTHRIVRHGGRIVEVPIEFRDRVAGESKLSKAIIGEAAMLVGRLWRIDLAGRRRRRRRGG